MCGIQAASGASLERGWENLCASFNRLPLITLKWARVHSYVKWVAGYTSHMCCWSRYVCLKISKSRAKLIANDAECACDDEKINKICIYERWACTTRRPPPPSLLCKLCKLREVSCRAAAAATAASQSDQFSLAVHALGQCTAWCVYRLRTYELTSGQQKSFMIFIYDHKYKYNK